MVAIKNAVSHVDAFQYGIVADGSDQYAALAALLASIADGGADPDGAQVHLPIGTIGLSAPLRVPDKVSLHGQGRRATILKALAGFATGVPVIELGPTGSGYAFDCYLKDLCVDCNNITGSTGVNIDRGQEGAGLRNVLVTNFKTDGVTSAAAQNAANLHFEDLELYGANGSRYAMNLDGIGGATLISRVTAVGSGTDGPDNMDVGIRLNNMVAVGGGFHFEGCATGLHLRGNDLVTKIDGISGPFDTSQDVTTLVLRDCRKAIVGGITRGAATNALVDNNIGLTITDDYIQDYGGQRRVDAMLSNEEPVSPSGGELDIDMSFATKKRCSTLAGYVFVTTPANALPGMELEIEFEQDGTGGRIVEWQGPYKGVTLAASGSANQIAIIRFRRDRWGDWRQTWTTGWG